MKAVVFTLGCKVNAYESRLIMSGLEKKGYEVSDELGYADIYVLNTCAVTLEAEKKSRQAVGRVRKFNPNAPIYVVGCASQNSPQSFLDKEGVKLVLGASAKEKLLNLLDQEGIMIEQSNCYYESNVAQKTETASRSYVKIQDGCNNFCSYCLIPYLRGRSYSRSIESIKNELSQIESKEVVITGINISDYRYQGKTLKDLLLELSNYDFRIRLGSLEVNVIDEEFLKALKTLKNFAPHFHLSLQSGSNKVLKEMNRHYTIEQFFSAVELIRKYFPLSAITTDVIVAFSTETDEDFEESYDTCKKMRFADIHCFKYSPRKGTKAFLLPRVNDETSDERMKKLLQLKSQLKAEYLESFVGKKLTMIGEEIEDGLLTGYSENYIRVYVESELKEDFVEVEVIRPFKDGVFAKII